MARDQDQSHSNDLSRLIELPIELQEMIFDNLDADDLAQLRSAIKEARTTIDEYSWRTRYLSIEWFKHIWWPHFVCGLFLADQFVFDSFFIKTGDPGAGSRFWQFMDRPTAHIVDLEHASKYQRLEIQGVSWHVLKTIKKCPKHDECSLQHGTLSAGCLLRCLFPNLRVIAVTGDWDSSGTREFRKTTTICEVRWDSKRPFEPIEHKIAIYRDSALADLMCAQPVALTSILARIHDWRQLLRHRYVCGRILENKKTILRRMQEGKSQNKLLQKKAVEVQHLGTKFQDICSLVARTKDDFMQMMGARWSEQFFDAGIKIQQELESSLLCRRRMAKPKDDFCNEYCNIMSFSEILSFKEHPTALALLDLVYEEACSARRHGFGAYEWDEEKKAYRTIHSECMKAMKARFYPGITPANNRPATLKSSTA